MIIRSAAPALASALLLAASTSAGLAADKVRVGLATAIYTNYAPVYAAEALGTYKAKGLEVEITPYQGGGAAQQALAAGAADIINFFPPGVAIAVKKGVKEKIISGGGPPTPHGWHLMVKSDSPIKSLKDLNGRKIGISAKGSTTDFYALWSGIAAGGQVTTVPVGGRGLIPGVNSGALDGMVLWPNLTYRLIEGGKYRSVVDFGAVMKTNLPEVWVASQAMIDTKPDVVRRFLEAVMKTTKHMQDNEAYGLGYIKKYTKEKNDSVAKLAYDVIIKNATIDGMIKPEWLQNSLELATIAGIKDLPPVDQLFTDKFVPINPN